MAQKRINTAKPGLIKKLMKEGRLCCHSFFRFAK